MLSKTQKQLADRIGGLLAESNMDEETRNLILKRAGDLPEFSLYKLLEMLEGEQKKLNEFKVDIDAFLAEQDQNWAQTKDEQKAMAGAIANKWAAKLG